MPSGRILTAVSYRILILFSNRQCKKAYRPLWKPASGVPAAGFFGLKISVQEKMRLPVKEQFYVEHRTTEFFTEVHFMKHARHQVLQLFVAGAHFHEHVK